VVEIVGVHGIHQLRRDFPVDQVIASMSAIWSQALIEGLGCPPEQLQVACSYYAPLLASPDVGQGDDALESLPEDAQDMILAWVAELGAPPVVTQGYATRPLRQAADWVHERFPALTRAAIAVLFGEVATYLRSADDGRRTAVRNEVAQVIADRQPQIVVAHSLGTVVAYEALWAHPELTVDLLITLGSPLGLSHAVFPRLEPPPTADRGACPPGVRRWVNIADVGDPVAIPRKLCAKFTGVDLDVEEAIAPVSFHDVRHYLSCGAVAATVSPYLSQP
jgi:hypothetical protein